MNAAVSMEFFKQFLKKNQLSLGFKDEYKNPKIYLVINW